MFQRGQDASGGGGLRAAGRYLRCEPATARVGREPEGSFPERQSANRNADPGRRWGKAPHIMTFLHIRGERFLFCAAHAGAHAAAVTTVLAGHLLFADLSQRLAVDAQIGGRTRFEATNADLHAARFAVAEIIVFHFLQRFLDLLISLRSRSRLRSSRLNSSSRVARSAGSGSWLPLLAYAIQYGPLRP